MPYIFMYEFISNALVVHVLDVAAEAIAKLLVACTLTETLCLIDFEHFLHPIKLMWKQARLLVCDRYLSLDFQPAERRVCGTLKKERWHFEIFVNVLCLHLPFVVEQQSLIKEVTQLQNEVDHKHILVCVQSGMLQL